MKTVELTSRQPSLKDLLDMARTDAVLVTTEDGERFVISLADDFDAEVQLLRRNHEFLTLLDELKKEDGAVPLEEAENRRR